MLFTSISFIFYFLPILLLIYFIVPNKFKNYVLLLFSLFFYFYGEPKYVFLMIIEILLSYIGGLLIEKYKKKSILITFVSLHILMLVIFKYSNFIILNINNIFNADLNYLKILLPIGISFYTFQMISYLIDVYYKRVEANKNIISYATYVSLFSQLIAGPIVRYKDIHKELSSRKVEIDKISEGIQIFIIGLSKKVLLANNFGLLVDTFMEFPDKSTVFYWIFALSYALQIYFDFSGYSDMAIGLGKMFGFNFPINFNYPYISSSITEFWRRWHITLGSWFRDYVYIPLGGNRKGFIKQIRNIFVVWMLTGLWHGASYNFIIWGLLFGVLLTIEKLFKDRVKIPKFIKHVYVIFIVLISFVIFYSTDLNILINNIKGLFSINNFINNGTIYYIKSYAVLLILGVIGSTPIIKKLYEKYKGKKLFDIAYLVIIFSLFIICIAYLVDASYNPFLYFRF